MAFLCPSRRGRQKKKHKDKEPKEPKAPFLGRITGSSSVDTLVRVGLEKQHGLTPEARMRVTQDFLATAPGELSAHQGDEVYRLYREGDWVYVITERGQEGFVPAICLTDIFKHSNNNNNNNSSNNSPTEGIHGNKLRVPGFHHKTASLDGGNGKGSTRHSSPKDSESTTVTYNLRNAEQERRLGKSFINTSTHADEGSDFSSNSNSPLSFRHQINPLPKPARTHSIPDVISNASAASVSQGPVPHINLTDQFSSPSNSGASKQSTTTTTTHNNGNNKYDNNSDTTTLYHDRLRRANLLELPLMKAGARDSHTSNGDSITEVKTFIKKQGRKLAIVFPFDASEENDLKAQIGEIVTVLNDKDPDWVWAMTKNRNEGFVPKSFTCPVPHDLLRPDDGYQAKRDTGDKPAKSRHSNVHDVRELVMINDFEAQSTDDIPVKSGDKVFADLANQIEKDWLWVYAPTSQSYGYIPRNNVRWMALVTAKDKKDKQ